MKIHDGLTWIDWAKTPCTGTDGKVFLVWVGVWKCGSIQVPCSITENEAHLADAVKAEGRKVLLHQIKRKRAGKA